MGAGRAWAHASGICSSLATATAADSILQSKLSCTLPWGCQLCPPVVYFTPDRTCHGKTPTPASGGRPSLEGREGQFEAETQLYMSGASGGLRTGAEKKDFLTSASLRVC